MANDISPPDLMLKIIWMFHFICSTWSLLSSYLPLPYFCSHFGFLAFAFWAIVSKESSEAILMSFVTLAFSVVNDILVISIYEPRTHDIYENQSSEERNEHRFAVAMSIINLIVKPISLFFLYRIYQSRSTGEDFLNTNNISNNFSGFGSFGRGQNQGAYSNIDSSQNAQQGGGYKDQGYSSGYQSGPPAYHQQVPPPAPSSPDSSAPTSGTGQQPQV